MKTRLFFLKEDEKKIDDVKLPKSKNAVTKVSYKCERSINSAKIAYKKEFSDKLSRISGLYETAFSAYIRLSLPRAAEVRVVYENNKPVAIASIELSDFKSMQKISLFRRSISETNPDQAMLLENNASEILACGLVGKFNDLSVDNYNIKKGLIDFGQAFFNKMSIVDGREFLNKVLGYEPLTAFNITAERIRNLPHNKEADHWPTHSPNNWNYFKTFNSKEAFASLKGNSLAEYQKYFYLLKHLLAFDKEVLRKRLWLYLGDEPLGLNELPKTTKETLCNIFTRKLYYDNQRELTFVEHCVAFFETQHKELLTVLIHMSEFREFIIKYPEAILDIKEWFIERNDSIGTDISYQLVHYDLEHIEREYQKIYRDCFVQPLYCHLSNLNNFIDLFKTDLNSYVVINEPNTVAISQQPKKTSYVLIKNFNDEKDNPLKNKKIDLSNSFLIVEQLPKLNNELKKSQLAPTKPCLTIASHQEDKKNEQEKQAKHQYKLLVELYSNLLHYTLIYFELTDCTLEKNHTYIRQVKEALQTKYNELSNLDSTDKSLFEEFIMLFETTLQTFWMPYIGTPEQLSESFLFIPDEKTKKSALPRKSSIDMTTPITDQCSNFILQKETIGPPIISSPVKIHSLPSTSLPLGKDELVISLTKFISTQILTLEDEHINAIVTSALTEYKPYGNDNRWGYLNPKTYTSNRSDGIIQLQKQYKSIPLLIELFNQKKSGLWSTSPGWDETSFNTKLIKHLSIYLLKDFNQYKNNASELI
ncbi:MAG: hypothetical protein JO131_07220, partial [Gammaproteobacteria bacterium]|nr:hypothetical protein [Gammaproteobacteria bacterium]